MNQPSRIKNLNLFTIHFPLPAIVSILHRVSGVILFLLIPFMLLVLSWSLTESGFEMLQRWLNSFYLRTLCWLLLIPFIFHLVAGIRHLLSDIGLGDSLKAGRLTAQLTFVVSILLVLLVGIWLW